MYNKKHLTVLLIDGAHRHTPAHTDTQKWTPSGLIEGFQLEERVSWRPELSWTSPPRVVFEVLDPRDLNPQQRCHFKYQGRRMKDGRHPARGRTRQRASAGKAKRSKTIRQANPNSNCFQSDRAKQLFTPRPGGRGLPLITHPPPPPPPYWTVLACDPLVAP